MTTKILPRNVKTEINRRAHQAALEFEVKIRGKMTEIALANPPQFTDLLTIDEALGSVLTTSEFWEMYQASL